MKREDLKVKLYSRNFNNWGFDFNIFVSLVSAFIVLAFIVLVLFFPIKTSDFFSESFKFLNIHFNWLFIFVLNVGFSFLLYLGFSKYGSIRLGGVDSKPEFSNFSWYSMLFSAGIGIGLFFYGVAEPIYHKSMPSVLNTGSGFDNFKIMYLHWGIHAWAIYALFAVGLGYLTYNRGLPFSLRSLFYPILKEKIFGIWGDIVDSIAVISVLFGLATSLGIGAQQINSGLNYIFGIPFSPMIQVFLIIGITLIAVLSVVSGIKRGVKFLSQLNVVLSSLLLFIILIIGPTIYVLSTYLTSFGLYISELFSISFFVASKPSDINWQGSWTIFYWAWWFSWTPFVSTFIARISKGRSIKELVFGVIILPTLIITFAMTILGATGVYFDELNNGAISNAITRNIATSMFEMFKYLTESLIFKNILSVLGVTTIVLFFVTSSDSGSLVVDNLSSGGKENSPVKQRIFWALAEGLIALSVLLLGGEKALKTIQSAVVIIGLPFSIIVLLIVISLVKEMKVDYQKYDTYKIKKLKKKIDKLN